MSGDNEFAQFLGQVLVVAIGWFVVNRLAETREREKARRDIVVKSAESMSEGIDKILAEGRAYHLADRDTARELSLKMTLQDLAMRMAAMSDFCAHERLLAPCRSDIAGVRRAVTGVHFEDEHDGKLPETSVHLQVMAESALKAKRSLLRLKHQQYVFASRK